MQLTRLSSRLTLVYKVLIPAGGLVGLAVYVALLLTQHWLLELHAVIAACGLAMWLLIVLVVSLRIRHVAYNKEFIRVRNYGRPLLLPAADFVSLLPALLPGYYYLRTRTHRLLFIGSVSDTLGKMLLGNPMLDGFRIPEPENISAAQATLRAASRPPTSVHL
jgi:hypothetical protein